MNDKFKTEAELAKVIVQYLKDMQWEVYQEVQIASFGSIADIVAVQNNLIWVLECKLSLGLNVIAQAENWINYSNYVSIVVPPRKNCSKSQHIVKNILEHYGIGQYEVSKGYDEEKSIVECVAPRLNRKASTDYIKRNLREEQKYWAPAGNADKLRYTPFQHTKSQVIRFVGENPKCTFKELILNIKHHYSSDKTAISSLRQWIIKGIIPELILKSSKGKYRISINKKYIKENDKMKKTSQCCCGHYNIDHIKYENDGKNSQGSRYVCTKDGCSMWNRCDLKD